MSTRAKALLQEGATVLSSIRLFGDWIFAGRRESAGPPRVS